jgi:hypothetical protein
MLVRTFVGWSTHTDPSYGFNPHQQETSVSDGILQTKQSVYCTLNIFYCSKRQKDKTQVKQLRQSSPKGLRILLLMDCKSHVLFRFKLVYKYNA